MTNTDEYLVGVGHAYYYDTTGNLVFDSKTQIENSVAASTSNTEVRGGAGNSLLYVYYHTAKLEVTLKDAQFNLGMIGAAMGASINTGSNVWNTETVTLTTGGAGTVSSTPLVSPDSSAIYGWVTDSNGVITKVSFNGSGFTLPGASSGDVVTVRYFAANAASKQIVIPAGIVPTIGRLVIDATLASSKSGTGVLGKVQVEIPRFQPDGSHTISLTSSGVYQSEVKGMALKYTDAAVANSDVYAKVTTIVNGSNWYDDVTLLAVEKDVVSLSSSNSTYQLVVYAVPKFGSAFVAPAADLTFTSGTTATATVNSSGLITRVAAGTANITVKITANPTVSTQIDVTAT